LALQPPTFAEGSKFDAHGGIPPATRIAATLPLGSVGSEPEPEAKGERLIWLEAATVTWLGAMRGPGESYSDAILSVAATEVAHPR
jgi:hypothetical protein